MGFKAIFLDRDDTIIDDPGYISRPEQLKLLPGAAEALRAMSKMGYKLVVVSNQSAVARGMVTEDGLAKIHDRLKRILADEGVYLDGLYYCPYHPEGVVDEYRKESELRKPQPGMLLKAAEEMGIDLQESWMIGDSYRDVEAGLQAGCKTILIHTPAKPKTKGESDPEPDYRAVNIKESANIIKMCLNKKTNSGDRRTTSKDESRVSNKPTSGTPEAQALKQETDNSSNNASFKKNDVTKSHGEASKQKIDYSSNSETHGINRVSTAKRVASEKPQTSQQNLEANRTEQLLREILTILKEGNRKDQYHEFSLIKLLAGIIQAVVVFCLLLAVWMLMEGNSESISVFKPLGFAAVLQFMCLTLYVMDEHK